eukprot:GFUD01020568.1.p1 GENE.GFUD01020568.1~~GFUD01020568.1.p1  ORF type:complete len:1219 (+),score=261.45 GFUD01020568.1:10-3666(+)
MKALLVPLLVITFATSLSFSPLQCGLCPGCSRECAVYADTVVSLQCQDESFDGVPEFFSESSRLNRLTRNNKNFAKQIKRGTFPVEGLLLDPKLGTTDTEFTLTFHCYLNGKRMWNEIKLKIYQKPEMKMQTVSKFWMPSENLKINCTTSSGHFNDSFLSRSDSQKPSHCQCSNHNELKQCQTVLSKANLPVCQSKPHKTRMCLCPEFLEESLYIEMESDSGLDQDCLYTGSASIKNISMVDNKGMKMVKSNIKVSIAKDDVRCLENNLTNLVFDPEELLCHNLTISKEAKPLNPEVVIRKRSDGNKYLPRCNNKNNMRGVKHSDAGEYLVECRTRLGAKLALDGDKTTVETIHVEVHTKPEISQFEIKTEKSIKEIIDKKVVYVLSSSQSHKLQLLCNASSSPQPSISFSVMSCMDHKIELLGESEDVKEERPCGVYTCLAENRFGKASKKVYFAQKEDQFINSTSTTNKHGHVGVFHQVFIEGERFNDEKIVENDEVVIVCKVSLIFNNLSNVTLRWKTNNKTLGNFSRQRNEMETNITVTVDTATEFVCIVGNDEEELVIETVRFAVDCDGLKGKCETIHSQKELGFREESLSIDVIDINKVNQENITRGNPLKIECNIKGVPEPDITWLFQGREVKEFRKSLRDHGVSYLMINDTTNTDQGNYTCIGSVNRGPERNLTNISGSVFITITDKKAITNIAATNSMAAVIVVLIVIVVSVIIVWIRQNRNMKEKLKVQIELFQRGNMSQLDETSNLLDQAELFPYDKALEIPFENLEFIKKIGDGAYGKVWKVKLTGPDSKTEVAVKTTNKKTNEDHLKSLMSELKMLQLLGSHTNILGLVGACTSKMDQRDMFLVLEYCHHGSLKNYLYKNRDSFVNEVGQKLDDQEFNEMTGYMKMRDGRHWQPFGGCGIRDNNSNLCKIDDGTDDTSLGHQTDCLSSETVRTSLSMESDNLSDNSAGSEKDGKVCTTDLFTWSVHISKGMEYLTSKNLLHGDLALRNVLLTKSKTAKICDFGLSRSLYTKAEYVKKSDSPLPYKWMALESIENGVFSQQSDVWAFGVTLWEVWELAKNPYFHHQVNEDFITKLHNGYRLAKPHLASSDLYELLTSCWRKCPSQRPAFSNITNSLESMTEMFDKFKVQQFLPESCEFDVTDQEDDNPRETTDGSEAECSEYIEMRKIPSTIDSYIRLSHNGYKLCLLENQKEEHNFEDGIFTIDC